MLRSRSGTPMAASWFASSTGIAIHERALDRVTTAYGRTANYTQMRLV
jgi:hypothetical protein